MKKKHVILTSIFLFAIIVSASLFSNLEVLQGDFSKFMGGGREIYVSPSGSDDGRGSARHPMSLTAALDTATDGASVVLKSGKYDLVDTLYIRNEISIHGKPGAVLNCSGLGTDWCIEFNDGIGDEVVFKEFVLTGTTNGVHIQGGSPLFEEMTFLRSNADDNIPNFMIKLEDEAADFKLLKSTFGVESDAISTTDWDHLGIQIGEGSFATIDSLTCEAYLRQCVRFIQNGTTGIVRNSSFMGNQIAIKVFDSAGGVEILNNSFTGHESEVIQIGTDIDSDTEASGEFLIAQNIFESNDDNGILIADHSGSINVEILANLFQDNGQADIHVEAANKVEILRNQFLGGLWGIAVKSAESDVDTTGETVIENNWFESYEYDGLWLSRVRDSIFIVNNVFFDVSTVMYSNDSVFNFAYNTLVNGEYALNLRRDEGSLIVDNIFYGFTEFVLGNAEGGAPQLGYNSYYDNELDSVGDPYINLGGNIYKNPKFVNLLGKDFHLLPSSSLIDAASGFIPVKKDYESTPRIVPDIGAYEAA